MNNDHDENYYITKNQFLEVIERIESEITGLVEDINRVSLEFEEHTKRHL